MNLANAVEQQGWRSANAAVALSQLGDLLKGQVPPFAPVLPCRGRSGAGEDAHGAASD